MKAPHFLTWITLVAGFSAGMAVTWRQTGKRAETNEATPPVTRSSAPPRSIAQSAKSGTSAAGSSHNLKALLRWNIGPFTEFSDFSTAIERMSATELKAMLLDGLFPYQDGEEQGLPMLRSALIRELFKREGEQALQWANGLGPKERTGILGSLVDCLAEQDFVAALPWIDGFRDEFGKEMTLRFSHQAIIGATRRGAAALLELRKLYGDRLRGAMIPQGGIPEDFDFGMYLAGTARSGQQFNQMQVMGLWAAKDRDAAFQYIKNAAANGTPGGPELFGLAFQGVAKMEGAVTAAGWVAGKLDELPAESRASAITSLYSVYGPPPPVLAKEIAQAFPNENDRVTLIASFIRPHSGKSPAADYQDTLGSGIAWAHAVETSSARYAAISKQAPASILEKQLAFYDDLMSKTAVPEPTRERVRAAWRPAQP